MANSPDQSKYTFTCVRVRRGASTHDDPGKDNLTSIDAMLEAAIALGYAEFMVIAWPKDGDNTHELFGIKAAVRGE